MKRRRFGMLTFENGAAPTIGTARTFCTERVSAFPDILCWYFLPSTASACVTQLAASVSHSQIGITYFKQWRANSVVEQTSYWPGHFGINRKSEAECQANATRLAEPIQKMMPVLRFFLAPLSCDPRTRKRIESAIARALYDQPGMIGAFQEQGVRYNPRIHSEQAVACVINSPALLLGVPQRFSA